MTAVFCHMWYIFDFPFKFDHVKNQFCNANANTTTQMNHLYIVLILIQAPENEVQKNWDLFLLSNYCWPRPMCSFYHAGRSIRVQKELKIETRTSNIGPHVARKTTAFYHLNWKFKKQSFGQLFYGRGIMLTLKSITDLP